MTCPALARIVANTIDPSPSWSTMAVTLL
jgi:hypothetical protein